MSDTQPTAFGSTAGQGESGCAFLLAQPTDYKCIQQQLENAATSPASEVFEASAERCPSSQTRGRKYEERRSVRPALALVASTPPHSSTTFSSITQLAVSRIVGAVVVVGEIVAESCEHAAVGDQLVALVGREIHSRRPGRAVFTDSLWTRPSDTSLGERSFDCARVPERRTPQAMLHAGAEGAGWLYLNGTVTGPATLR
jgi:hypothetical protein